MENFIILTKNIILTENFQNYFSHRMMGVGDLPPRPIGAALGQEQPVGRLARLMLQPQGQRVGIGGGANARSPAPSDFRLHELICYNISIEPPSMDPRD